MSKYSGDSEILGNVMRFDVLTHQPLSFWIMQEHTYFHHDRHLNKAYFQNITQFLVGDYFELNIPILSEKGIIKMGMTKQKYLQYSEVIIPCFKWKTLQLGIAPQYNLLLKDAGMEGKGREILDFDTSRFCEVELVKNVWKKMTIDSNPKTFKSLTSVFEPYFVLKEIWWDNIGYLVYKLVLIACIEGNLVGKSSCQSIGKFDSLGISIHVRSITSPITNEVKKNSLIFDRKNAVECRVGDILIFYFTHDVNNANS